jgi:hypothetical protein
MEDDKKIEPQIPPTAEQTDKPLAVQMVNAVIDGTATLAKTVIAAPTEHIAKRVEKTKVGKAAVKLAKKAKKAMPWAPKKTAPQKPGAKKSAAKKSPPKKLAARKSKVGAKKTAAKPVAAKKTPKQSAKRTAKKSAKKTVKKPKR